MKTYTDQGDAYVDLEHLIDGIREGDESSGAFLVSLYGQRLLGYAHDIGSDLSEGDREIICERAVERAVRKIDLFDEKKGTFFAWLRTILRREVSNWRRSSARFEEWDDQKTSDGDKESADEDGDGEGLGKRIALGELLSLLPPEDQLILWARYGEQLPYAQLALRLNISEQACRQRCLRARSKARKLASSDPKWAWAFVGGNDGV